jgi:nucleoid-associated protein YgaU
MASPKVVLSALLLLPACDARPAAAAAADGSLVLEVGGDQSSLAQDLRSMGVELLPRRQPPPAATPPAPAPFPPANQDPAAETPPPMSEPPVTSEPDWIEVEIKPGQTIGALAKEHLGTSRRYQEILDLNHLTEAMARRIKAGSKIKIPKAKAAAGR